jgi:hypothetical protein
MDDLCHHHGSNTPVQVSDDGSVIVGLTDSEQWEIQIKIHNVADGTGWQDRSIPNSIGGSELGASLDSTGPPHAPTTKGGAVIGCGAPLPHVQFDAWAFAKDNDKAAFTDQGDEGNKDKALYVAAASPPPPGAKRSRRASQRRSLRPCTLARSAAAYAAATAPLPPPPPPAATPERSTSPQPAACVPRNGVRAACARAGPAIVDTRVTVDGGAEAAAAFAPSLTDPAKPLVDEFSFGACTESGVRIEESTVAAAPVKTLPAEPPLAPPPAPALTDNGHLRGNVGVIHEDDDNQHPEEEIEGLDGGLCVYPVQHLHRLPSRENLLSPPAPDDTSATGRTYDDITKPPPPHLRCVVSPFSSLPPVLRCTAAPLPLSPTSWVETQAVLFARMSLSCQLLGY